VDILEVLGLALVPLGFVLCAQRDYVQAYPGDGDLDIFREVRVQQRGRSGRARSGCAVLPASPRLRYVWVRERCGRTAPACLLSMQVIAQA